MAHASKTFSKVSVKVGDTDVVVLAVTLFDRLNITELWLEFAAGKAMRFIPVHKVVRSFSIPYLAFPFFHAYSGCDTCSAFNGKGKKTAMMAWRAVPEVTPVFLKLSHKPSEITEDDITLLETFIVVMYSRTCNTETVNEARKILFAQENRTIDNIPPTKDALIQHTKRAVNQAGFVWAQSLTNQQVLPSPLEWGWKLMVAGFRCGQNFPLLLSPAMN